MAQTFENLWRQARSLVPGVPPLVVREWAQDAFVDACAFANWGFLRSEAFLVTLAARNVTVVVTQGSATVTSAGGFVATDQGRQFRIGTYPVYTIRYSDPNTIVLDQVYQAADDPAATAQILNAYAVLPADFGSFLAIYNPYEQRIVPFWLNQDQLAIADPARTISDAGPRHLVAYRPSGETATLGQVQYEYHPYPTAARQYPYLYLKEGYRLADADLLPGVFANRNDVLKLGIQMKAAQWPGTRDQPNPYFNLGNYDRLAVDWEKKLQALWLADDAQYPDQYLQIDWAKLVNQGIVNNSNWLRQTDADVSALYP